MIPTLAVITPASETIPQKVQRLQSEAKQLAKGHIATLTQALFEAGRIAAEISDGGDAYPPGVRDMARRLVEDCEARTQTIEAIVSRS